MFLLSDLPFMLHSLCFVFCFLGWTKWAPWGSCTPGCGPGGLQSRTRSCVADVFGNIDTTVPYAPPCVPGSPFSNRTCTRPTCPRKELHINLNFKIHRNFICLLIKNIILSIMEFMSPCFIFKHQSLVINTVCVSKMLK